MEIRRYWGFLRKWYWLMVLGTLLAAGGAYFASSAQKPMYAATVTLQVNQTQNPSAFAYNDLLLSERLTKTYSELLRKRAILEPVMKELPLDQSYETFEAFASHVAVTALRDTQLIQVTVQNHNPQLAADIANKIAAVFIAQVAESQGSHVSAARDGLRRQIAAVQDEIGGAAAAIERLRAPDDARSAEAKAAEEARLQSTLSQYQLVYSQLVKSEQELGLAEAKATAGVRAADPAVVPTIPVGPRTTLNTLIAAVVGLLLSIGVVAFVEYLDDTVKTAEDLERAVDVPTLGVVSMMPSGTHNGDGKGNGNGNRDGKGKSKSLIVSNPRLHFGEAYRTLRTNIQFATLNRPGQVLMVASALQGEGKSFTLANLAVVIAQTGKSVLVVDSDVRRPSQHKQFHVTNDVGLTDLLLSTDLANVGPYIKQTEYEGLRLMTSGPTPPNPSELLSSPQMARVVEVLRKEADVVLFDSPPTLAVADAVVLSALVDGVLLVVEQGRNRSEAIVRVTQDFSRPGAAVLGAVLNRFKAGADGYYHYYDHEGYQAEDSPVAKSANGA